MVTVEKPAKPKILTESDHILNDLKAELAGLQSRMSAIEEEQEKNRVLLNQLTIQEDVTNDLINTFQSDNETHRENYQVIANVMRDLRSPVSSVVDNLAGIISSVDDTETQETLKQCMDTASNVIHSFNEVADFCTDASSDQFSTQQVVNLKALIQKIATDYQADTTRNRSASIRFQVDYQAPDTCAVYQETIETCLINLLDELANIVHRANIGVKVSLENNEIKYGFQLSDLTFYVELEGMGSIPWQGSWVEAIQRNKEALLNQGFNLLKTRDTIRRCGGYLEVLLNGDNLGGFRFSIPLTY